MVKVTIELPDEIRYPLADTGKFTVIPVKQIAQSPKQIAFAAMNGFMGALGNVSRGKDESGKPNSDSVFAAMREKRMKPWIEGADSWGSTERGESAYTAMREVWIDDYRARTNATHKEAEAFIRAKVEERLGKDTKATFGAFLDASALELVDAKAAASTDEARSLLESHLTGLIEARDKARAEAAEKVAVPAFDLSAFKKPAK